MDHGVLAHPSYFVCNLAARSCLKCLILQKLYDGLKLISLSLSVDKVTTDEELEEMLHRDNLSIFISDVGVNVRQYSRSC